LHGHNVVPVGYFGASEAATANAHKSWAAMREVLQESGAIFEDIPIIHTYRNEVPPAPPMQIFKASVREEAWKKQNLPYEKVIKLLHELNIGAQTFQYAALFGI
jgi:hypothetical protein